MRKNALSDSESPNLSQENSDNPAKELENVKSIGGAHCRCGTARARERFRGLCAACYLTERVAEGSWDPQESIRPGAGVVVVDKVLS